MDRNDENKFNRNPEDENTSYEPEREQTEYTGRDAEPDRTEPREEELRRTETGQPVNDTEPDHMMGSHPARDTEPGRTESSQPAEATEPGRTETGHPARNTEPEHTRTSRPAAATAEKPKKKKKSGIGLGALLGGVIGGVISAIAVVMLVSYNIIPLNQSGGNGETAGTSQDEGSPEVVATMATDNAETAANISETAEAVVGVVNLQQQSVWTESQQAGAGSGIIYKKEDGSAYVVTNQHVVEGAEEVEVVLNDDTRIPATVLGTDALTDLAVLEIDGENIDTVANLGSSSDLTVGETVMAIGNPLGMQFANTVTQGIISGLERSVPVDTNGDQRADWMTEVIQTDAAINPGNSGGALVNTEGEVIGINSMKIAQQAVEGIGFAIPIDSALPIMEQLESGEEVERPFIGISTASLSQVPPQAQAQIELPDDVEGGMVIAQVEPGSSAEAAGLQQFDVITQINGNPITSILELRQFLYQEATIGETVEIEYYRDGNQQTVDLQLQPREEQEEQPAA
ncbi:S1C family serine protease [Lentibacillus sediminis]|uniref:S1C family serine protease n=1 Tax=Lentibacillus sediminis TaxID=1940529 RepID=UPI001EFCFB34|nr:trypsin-like peptidase domain-containing protein [Lentibacillus sediminis]